MTISYDEKDGVLTKTVTCADGKKDVTTISNEDAQNEICQALEAYVKKHGKLPKVRAA